MPGPDLVCGLGIDAGGSATRWAVCTPDAAVLATGEMLPVSGHLFNPDQRHAFETFALRLPGEIGGRLGGKRIGAVVAGVTGLTGDAPEAGVAAGILAGAFTLPPGQVRVEDDLWIGFHAAFRPGEGHVVYAGTGSVGMHLCRNGTIIRVGGRGMLIDDAGSAFWIARQALDLVYRRIDEGLLPGVLGAALFASIGGSHWNDVRVHVYGGGRKAMALLALAVADAARQGDADALDILSRAGCELARLALALCRRVGNKPVALRGRAAGLHPAIPEGFHIAAPAIALRHDQGDAAIAAARLAAEACERPRRGAG